MKERREWEEEEEEEEGSLESGLGALDLGLGAIFKGIESIMGSVTELSARANPAAAGAAGMTGRVARMSGKPGTTGLFGFSVGQLSTGEPKVEPFGNIRRTEKGPVVDEVREPMVDLFEDEDHLLVVAELPGVTEQDISHEVKGGVLRISSRGPKKYSKELSLPASVDPDGIEATYNNGILQLKLKKTRQE